MTNSPLLLFAKDCFGLLAEASNLWEIAACYGTVGWWQRQLQESTGTDSMGQGYLFKTRRKITNVRVGPLGSDDVDDWYSSLARPRLGDTEVPVQ